MAETLAALQARYPAALVQIFDVMEIRDRGAVRPGQLPAHIFDFEDGLRLIVSRDRHEAGEILLHFSGSFPDDCRIADEFRLLLPFQGFDRLFKKWCLDLPRRFAELSGDHREAFFSGVAQSRIPHWFIPEKAVDDG